MDLYAERRRQLRKLIDDDFAGSQAQLAYLIGRQASYISRILRGKRRLGEKLAREIEDLTDKSKGWLDGPDPGSTYRVADAPRKGWPFSIDRRRYDRLTAPQKATINRVLSELIAGLEESGAARTKRPAKNRKRAS